MTATRSGVLPLVIGAVVHTVAWLAILGTRIAGGDLTCSEESCYRLFLLDLPISLLYAGGDAAAVTIGSFIGGAALWGIVILGLTKALAGHR